MREFLRYLFVVAAMLMVVVGDVWGKTYYGKAEAYSIPSGCGYIWVTINGTSFSEVSFSQTSYDHSSGSKKNVWVWHSPEDFDAQYYAKPMTDYKFIGWYDENGNLKSASTSNNCSYKETFEASSNSESSPTTIKRYAYFVKYNASATIVDFGEVAYNSGTRTKEFTVDCHNVGTWSALSYNTSSPFSVSISNNKGDDSNHTAKITVTLNTVKSGSFNETLKITTSKGGTINVTLKANINANPTYTWNPEIWNVDGSQKRIVYVDEVLDNIVSSTSNGTKSYSFDFSTNPGDDNTGATGTTTFANNKVTCYLAGTLNLRISQEAEDGGYNAGGDSRVLVISKHTPEFTWNLPVYYNREVADFFSTTGSNALTYSSSDEDVATLSTGSNAQKLNLTTYNKEASTTITITQAENYYWYGKTETKVVTPIDPNNHVPFVVTENNDNEVFIKNSYYGCKWNNGVQVGDGAGGFNRDNAKFILIEFSGIPDKLIFDYEPREVHITNTTTHPDNVFWFVQESTTNEGEFDGEGNNPFWDNKEYIWSTTSKNAGNTDSIQLSPNTKCIRLGYWGNFGTAFKNITVTEREEFHAVDNSDNEVEFLDFGANQVNTSKPLSFDLKYANAGYKVNLVTNDSRFTVNPTSINTIGGCKFGKEPITVTYTSNVSCKIEGESSYLTITDELGHHEIVYLLASSYKLEQTIEWRDDFEAVEKPIIRMKDGQITDAATASSSLPVTYTSSDTTVIAVRNEGTVLLPKAAGEATITATQVGDETWLPVSDSKTFIVTDKIVQYIGWGDDLTDLVIGDADMTLTAKVYLRNEETQEYIYSEERTKLLQYSVRDVNVVTVSGDVLSIKGVGQTTATVTAPGDEDYAAATLTIPVHVRTKTAGCEDVLLLNHLDEVGFFAYNTNEIVQGPFGIDKEKGVPGFLSFQHRGASWDLGIQYYGGKIKAQYVTENNSTWRDAIEVTPIEDQTTLASGISLPRDATQIRFVRPSGGTGYHYVSNIQVHPAQYLEAPAEIDFGEIHVGSIETRSFEVNYSNIKDMVAVTTSSVDVTVSPPSFGKCGDYGQQTIVVTWIPSQVDVNEQKVILQDHTSLMQSEVILKAKVVQGIQHLNWQDRPTVISNCGEIEFPKQTNAHIDIKWEVINGKDVADFNGNGELELYKQGTITVKGSNTGNANYNEFYIEYVFSIEYEPIFVGTENTDWNNPNNWNICRLPNENDIVTIKALVELVTHEKVKGMKFAENGKMHIAHNAGMTIGSHGLELTTNGLITIDNTPDGAGFLKVDPSAANKPSANVTINYTTAAYNSGNPRDEIWQYMGAPGTGMDIVADEDKTLIYHWSEVKGWEKQTDEKLTPFAGYVFTQNKDKTKASFEITATPIIADKTIDLTCTPNGMRGGNVFANSYLAPIDVAKIDVVNDLVDVEGTFYLFNSGSWNQWQSEGGKEHMNYGVSPGQYYALSPKGASLMDKEYDQTTIPPMQGVYVVALSNNAQIKLDYAKHVYGAEASNRPMRAPEMRDEDFKRVRLQVNSQNSGADRMYVIQHEDASKGYDYGYDAKNIAAEDQVNIYTSEQGGQMEISVSNRIDSTYIGFQAGSDSEYRLRITSVVGEKLLLKDLETETVVAVEDEVEYTFSATPKSVNNKRFLLIDQLAGEEIDDLVKVYIYDNVVHVLEAPKDSDMAVYSVGGLLMARYEVGETPCTVELSGLPTGVYLVRIADKAFKFVCK